jgi:hypothetical protein
VTQPDESQPLDIARGNKALSNYLIRSLELLRDRSDSQDFQRLVGDVLEGRTSIRDVYDTPAFAAGIDGGVRQFGERWDQLSQDERDALARRGQEVIDAENERLRRASP